MSVRDSVWNGEERINERKNGRKNMPGDCFWNKLWCFAFKVNSYCTTIHRYPFFSARYSAMCKVYTGYHGTREIEHGLCTCTVDNPRAKARGLSLRIGAQTMLCLSLTTLFLVRLRPPRRLTSTKCTHFASTWQLPFLNQRKELRNTLFIL